MGERAAPRRSKGRNPKAQENPSCTTSHKGFRPHLVDAGGVGPILPTFVHVAGAQPRVVAIGPKLRQSATCGESPPTGELKALLASTARVVPEHFWGEVEFESNGLCCGEQAASGNHHYKCTRHVEQVLFKRATGGAKRYPNNAGHITEHNWQSLKRYSHQFPACWADVDLLVPRCSTHFGLRPNATE